MTESQKDRAIKIAARRIQEGDVLWNVLRVLWNRALEEGKSRRERALKKAQSALANEQKDAKALRADLELAHEEIETLDGYFDESLKYIERSDEAFEDRLAEIRTVFATRGCSVSCHGNDDCHTNGCPLSALLGLEERDQNDD